MKPVFRMSNAPYPGACIRPMVASQLGYEAAPRTGASTELLEYCTRLEALVADKLHSKHGLDLADGGECPICKNRNGIHTELHHFQFDCVGHMDREVILEHRFPVEIKNLGRFTWEKFSREKFGVYPNYASQEALYLESRRQPGLYVVANRDTGELLTYSIPYDGQKLQIPGFEILDLPFQSEDVISKYEEMVPWLEKGELPPSAPNSSTDQCRWCDYKHMCSDAPVKTTVKEIKNVPALVDAAALYKKGIAMEQEGKDMKDTGKAGLLTHAKSVDAKYQVAGVSVTYRGTRTKTTIDESVLKSLVTPEILEQATKISAPFDDYTIRQVKEE